MKKKRLLLLLPVILALGSCSFDGALDSIKNVFQGQKEDQGNGDGGNQEGHVCEFETNWTTTETHHWHKCTDETCTEKSNYGEHDFDGAEWVTVTPATETAKGQKKRACVVCGYEQFDEIPMTDHVHTYEKGWTSDETGHWHAATCQHKDEKSGFEAHDFEGVEWVVTAESTEFEKGSHYRCCKVCGYKQIEELPLLDHEHTYDPNEWDYNEDNHWNTCNNTSCGEHLNTAAHEFGEWVVTKDATEKETGSKYQECSVCHYKNIVTIPVLEHVHTFAEEWTSNETSHWHAATCEHSEEKSNLGEHKFGEWYEKTAPTDKADGVSARVCEVCSYEETKPILHKQFDVAYHFSNAQDYFMEDTVYGLNMVADGSCGNGYDGLYISMSSIKVELATAYTFKIRNNGDSTLELRISYRNSSTKAFAVSTNVEDYSITSELRSSSTKVKSYKDGYVRFGIASKDTADITVALASQDYDQFIFMPVHANNVAASLTIIKTGYVAGTHNWNEQYSFDEEYHWLTCADEGCAFICNKGKHDWVSDKTKEDIPSTETEEGTAFKVCSVCGKTKEVKIPVIGGVTERDIDMMEIGFNDKAAYTLTPGDGKLSVTYSITKDQYDKMAVKNISSVKMTKLTYISLKLKNTGASNETFCVTAKDGSTYLIPNGATNLEVVSSELGTSRVERVGSTCAYLIVGAGDTVEYKIPTLATNSLSELSLFVKPDANKTGSFELYKFSIHDDFSQSEDEDVQSAEVYGTWGGYSICTVTKNGDSTSTVTYSQTDPVTSGNLQLQDFTTLLASYAGKTIKSMSLEVTNLCETRLHCAFQIKDNDGVVSSSGTATGGLTYDRHSSGTGEYFYMESNGTGTINAVITEGKVPTKVRFYLASDQAGVSGSFKIGKITLTF